MTDLINTSKGTNQVQGLSKKLNLHEMKIREYLLVMVDVGSNVHKGSTLLRENYVFSCYEEVCLAYGRYFPSTEGEAPPLNVDNPDPDSRWITAFRCLKTKNLIYAEGYVLLAEEKMPIEHAWLVDKDTVKVVDPIWHGLGLAYYGIPFERDFVISRAKETRVAGIFDTDLNSEKPILKLGLPENAIWKEFSE